MKKIVIDSVFKAFGEKNIFTGVSLELSSESRYALVGPSGSGKTTLLRLIAKLDQPDNGQIVPVPGNPIISYSFQEPRLFPSLTVKDNIELIDPERDPEDLLLKLGLSEEADSLPVTLSGGMQKRAALARALSKEADIYLLDEPTGGQDREHANDIAYAITYYTQGSLCIVATHDSELIPQFADTILMLHDGMIDITQVSDPVIYTHTHNK